MGDAFYGWTLRGDRSRTSCAERGQRRGRIVRSAMSDNGFIENGRGAAPHGRIPGKAATGTRFDRTSRPAWSSRSSPAPPSLQTLRRQRAPRHRRWMRRRLARNAEIGSGTWRWQGGSEPQLRAPSLGPESVPRRASGTDRAVEVCRFDAGPVRCTTLHPCARFDPAPRVAGSTGRTTSIGGGVPVDVLGNSFRN